MQLGDRLRAISEQDIEKNISETYAKLADYMIQIAEQKDGRSAICVTIHSRQVMKHVSRWAEGQKIALSSLTNSFGLAVWLAWGDIPIIAPPPDNRDAIIFSDGTSAIIAKDS